MFNFVFFCYTFIFLSHTSFDKKEELMSRAKKSFLYCKWIAEAVISMRNLAVWSGRDLGSSVSTESGSRPDQKAWMCSLLLVLLPAQPLPHAGHFQQTTNWWYFSYFPRKLDLTFHANCLLRRQFAWNVISCFLRKIRKIFKNVVCWKFYPEC